MFLMHLHSPNLPLTKSLYGIDEPWRPIKGTHDENEMIDCIVLDNCHENNNQHCHRQNHDEIDNTHQESI